MANKTTKPPLLNYLVQGALSDREVFLQTLHDVPTSRHYTIVEYCTEEVRRQNRDWTAMEEAERVAWMLLAWLYVAQELSLFRSKPNVDQIVVLGALVERDVNANGLRDCQVGILASGDRIRPIGSDKADVKRHLEVLCDDWRYLGPLEWYREFEKIHPFVDGNGRVGKLLLNWHNGTLLENPIFPPNDFWGEPIVNP